MVDFTHIDTFVFDLDNTLYPADCHLFKQIDDRMSQFIQQTLALDKDRARYLQKHYYAVYGTTLSGLMTEHGIAPQDFLDFVHDIDLSVLEENSALRKAIGNLPGKRYVFTNGSTRHAENVAGKLGILDLFDGIFDIEKAEFTPKPHTSTYLRFTDHFNINPRSSAMFEDMPDNLKAAYELGKTTVLVQSDADWFNDEPEDKRPARVGETFDHVHHVTRDLTSFLTGLKTAA